MRWRTGRVIEDGEGKFSKPSMRWRTGSVGYL